MGVRKRILIVVKTYPLPSKSHKELVCTGGVLEDGSFIRLYPIDYRYKPYWEWYKKYQWIELEIEKSDRDPRPESYRPVPGAKIRLLNKLSTDNNWAERKRFVLAKEIQSMCTLEKTTQNECSLGIIRPREVTDMIVEKDARDWKPRWKALFQQQDLFGPQRKPLEKIPFKFYYVFKCQDTGCKGHKKIIEDWEIAQLYRSMRDKYQDENIAIEKVKLKFFNQICGPDKNIHFFVGTVLRFGSWVILGTFYPEKE